MSADLYTWNGQAQLVYSRAGGIPWHGEGFAEPGSFTFERLFAVAPVVGGQLDKVPAYVWIPNADVAPDDPAFTQPTAGRGCLRPAHDAYHIRRRLPDGSHAFVGAVGKRFTNIQPARDIAHDLSQALLGEFGAVELETAGLLGERGERGVFLCRVPEPSHSPTGLEGDRWFPYLAISVAFDGSGALRMWGTSVRIVCKNTERWSLARDRAKGGTSRHGVRHTESWRHRAETVVGMIRVELAKLGQSQERHARLAETGFDRTQMQELADRLVGIGQDGKRIASTSASR